MTVGNFQAKTRPSPTMDFLQQNENFGIGQNNYDHSLTDHMSIFDYSPGSLYKCDMEKSDMQSSFEGMNSQSSQYLLTNEDCDLPDNYEITQNILPNFSDSAVVPDSCTGVSKQNANDNFKHMSFDMDAKDVSTVMQNNMQEPTLAAINSQIQLQEYISPKNPSLEKAQSKLSLTPLTNWLKATESSQTVPTQISFPESKTMKTKLLTQMLSGGSMMSVGARQVPQTVTSPDGERGLSEIQLPFKEKKSPSSSSSSSSVLTALPQASFYKNVPTQGPSSMKGVAMNPSNPVKRKSPSMGLDYGREPANIGPLWDEVKQFIDDDQPTPPKVKRENRESVGSTKTLADDSDDYLSTEEEDEEDVDNTDYDSDDSQEQSWSRSGGKGASRKKEMQHFWQYNIQSKGPKGTRMNFDLESINPHVLKGFQDPVFDAEVARNLMSGNIRHGGKARKGDGNDVRPNPKKLSQIGEQLKKLNKQINQFGPLGDMPVSNRNKSKKEKNKLASRACRLKKKAQHEAYKVKLYGLELEHKQLMNVLLSVKTSLRTIVKDIDEENSSSKKMIDTFEEIINKNLTVMVAGNTTDYVNSVIKKVEDGDLTGGLGS